MQQTDPRALKAARHNKSQIRGSRVEHPAGFSGVKGVFVM